MGKCTEVSVQKKVESSFICRRCKGESSEARQVNGLHIDGHEYEIVDKFCYLGQAQEEMERSVERRYENEGIL